MEYVLRRRGERPAADVSVTSRKVGDKVRAFHQGVPGYAPTGLVERPALARELGVGRLWVKDESTRFGLNAFKGLGGSYAVACALARRLGLGPEEMSFEVLCSPESREKLGQLTFVTATDGNHGRGVAWAARVLGHKAVVYMPKGSARERLDNILAQGAQAEITQYNYDDAVRLASRMAREQGWILVQDTAWEDYEEIPRQIMQGYTTMAAEIVGQLEGEIPTHLFLQAGVGSFAGAVQGYFAALWGDSRPITLVMEPDKADCLFRTAKADDGRLHFVTGDMDSMMAGLCCGEPCTISWEILNSYADGFVSCGDECAVKGMRLLGLAREGDAPVVSGESGAVGVGVLHQLMKNPLWAPLRQGLGLDGDSRVLIISTEGDTDRENYKKILSQQE